MSLTQTVCEAAGYKTRSYSGRGMYGKRCLAVVFKSTGALMADILMAMDLCDEDRHEVAQSFRRAHEDSMGRDSVIYFPEIPFDGTEDEDSEEESDKE